MRFDDDPLEELLRERPASDAADTDDPGRRSASGASRLRGESLARLLDAAVLVVHAIGDLTAVAEDVLAEQRDRLRAEQPTAEAHAGSGHSDRGSPAHGEWVDRPEHIDLTY